MQQEVPAGAIGEADEGHVRHGEVVCEVETDRVHARATVAVGVLVAVGARVDVAVSAGVSVELCVGVGVEIGLGVSIGVAVPMSGVGLLVGADWHPFNAAETTLMRQSIVSRQPRISSRETWESRRPPHSPHP